MIDLYSKRQKRLRGEVPDVYQYDDLPQPLRVQVIHIWDDAIGISAGGTGAEGLFEEIKEILCREYGVFDLSEQWAARNGIRAFFLSTNELECCLDVVELVFRAIDRKVRDAPVYFLSKLGPDEAIQELNARFLQHGLGYQYAGGQIIRVDSELLHRDATVPAFSLLRQIHFAGANQEFMSAHEHYRHGRYKECLNDCLKSFESTMKAISDKRGWTYQPGDAAKKLISICKDNGLFPVFMDNHLNGLVMCLESGVPTARNKTSGHGQGTTPTNVEPEFAAYVLHITAANILFLGSAEKRLK